MAAIDIAADLGCSLSQLGERLPKNELTLWLARYMRKMDYTYNKADIVKHKENELLRKAREHWKR